MFWLVIIEFFTDLLPKPDLYSYVQCIESKSLFSSFSLLLCIIDSCLIFFGMLVLSFFHIYLNL